MTELGTHSEATYKEVGNRFPKFNETLLNQANYRKSRKKDKGKSCINCAHGKIDYRFGRCFKLGLSYIKHNNICSFWQKKSSGAA